MGNAIIIGVHFFVDIFLLYLIESGKLNCCSRCNKFQIPEKNSSIEYDDDVQNERDRIMDKYDEVIRVHDFRKAYTKAFSKPFMAVEQIDFGIDYGECFALLGVNGAGKSTTFKSLTGGVTPTQGEITIAGYDTVKDFEKVRKLIGYCPQHDAIFPLLSVEEHLEFYTVLKGIP